MVRICSFSALIADGLAHLAEWVNPVSSSARDKVIPSKLDNQSTLQYYYLVNQLFIAGTTRDPDYATALLTGFPEAA